MGERGNRDEKLVLFILADVTGHSPAPRKTCWGGRWGSLAREGPPKGGGGGALMSRAAAGALLGTDGLQHPTFSLLQHVLQCSFWTKHFQETSNELSGLLLPLLDEVDALLFHLLHKLF